MRRVLLVSFLWAASCVAYKIIGGTPVDISECPYQLSLEQQGVHACGAVIISDDWALTAAHCVDDAHPNQIRLRAGTSIRGSNGSVHQAVEIIWNQNLTYNLDYDIALIRVGTPFAMDNNTQPVSLPPAYTRVPVGVMAFVTGWGVTEVAGSLSDQLQGATVPVWRNSDCDNEYSVDVTDRMLCAGYKEGSIDSCQGDSGGPLVYNNTLIGLVSWGHGCAEPMFPGIYTNVSTLRNWIFENSGV